MHLVSAQLQLVNWRSGFSTPRYIFQYWRGLHLDVTWYRHGSYFWQERGSTSSYAESVNDRLHAYIRYRLEGGGGARMILRTSYLALAMVVHDRTSKHLNRSAILTTISQPLQLMKKLMGRKKKQTFFKTGNLSLFWFKNHKRRSNDHLSVMSWLHTFSLLVHTSRRIEVGDDLFRADLQHRRSVHGADTIGCETLIDSGVLLLRSSQRYLGTCKFRTIQWTIIPRPCSTKEMVKYKCK